MADVTKAKGRTLAEFQPLLPAEKKLLAAAREGEVADIDAERPEGFLFVYAQQSGAQKPQNHFKASPTLATARWKRAPHASKDGSRLWAARLEGVDLLALRNEPQVPRQVIHLVAAHNARGWSIPHGIARENVALDAAVADLEDRRLRPGFVRFLALGGDDEAPLHEKGLRVRGGWIDGDLDCKGAALPHDLILWGCRLDGDLILLGATMRTLDLEGTRLNSISADRVVVEGSVFLRNGFHASGETRFTSACVGGTLDCTASRFENLGSYAISCHRIEVNGSIFLRHGFHASGATSLLGARIGGNLEFDGGTCENSGGVAVQFDGADIKGDVFLRNGFLASGKTHMLGASIGGDLSCVKGRFENPGNMALHCDRVEVAGSVFLRNDFHAIGETRLLGARIGGDLSCVNGRFDNSGGVALRCDGVRIAGALFLRADARLDGALALSGTHVDALVDEANCWPRDMVLDGFIYDCLSGDAPVDAAARLRWLDRQRPAHLAEDFRPQPWEQLIKVLREMGHHQAARDIAIEKQNRLRRVGRVGGPLARGLHWAFGALAGYGYRPLRPVRIAFVCWLGFALFYHLMAGQGVFGPSNPLVFDNPKYAHCRPDAPEVSATGKPRVGNWVWCADAPGEYAAFSPLAYSLDLILPVVTLGQANEWGPITPASAPDMPGLQRFGNLMFDILKIGDPRTWDWLQNPDDPAKWREFLGLVTRFAVWMEILIGWLFSGLMVAVLSGLAKKDDA